MKRHIIPLICGLVVLLLCACGETSSAELSVKTTIPSDKDIALTSLYIPGAKEVELSVMLDSAYLTQKVEPPSIHIVDTDITVISDNLPYDYIRDFSEGVSIVGNLISGSSFQKKYGMIDSEGNLIADLKYDYIMDMREGMAVFGMDMDSNSKTGDVKGGYGIDKYGFLNAKGEEVIPPIYNSVGYFSEGLAAVINYSERYITSYM